jgi:hypothetical protein
VAFDALEKKALYEPLDSVAEQIRMLINSNPPQYPPEVVQPLIEMVERMNDEFGKELPTASDAGAKAQVMRRVLQRAETFTQAGWNVNEVTQAQNIFNFVLGPARKAIEEPDPSISIPVVLLVMTRIEARQLDRGAMPAMIPADYWEHFNALKAFLEPDWIERYGTTPEEWRPFGTQAENIKNLLSDLFAEVRQKKDCKKALVPEIIDVRTLLNERKRLTDLRRDGCFVINDVISMWHPDVQSVYRTSLLEAFPTTIVFRIAPIVQALGDTQPLIQFPQRYRDLEFFKRIRSDRDLRCRDFLSANQWDDFASFVFNYAWELIPSSEKATTVVTQQIIGSSGRN